MSNEDIVDVSSRETSLRAAKMDGLKTWGWISYALHLVGNLCINPQRMCLHMRAGCGSIPAYAAIRSRPESLHQEDSQACIS